jgi:hypothetical protein
MVEIRQEGWFLWRWPFEQILVLKRMAIDAAHSGASYAQVLEAPIDTLPALGGTRPRKHLCITTKP